MLLPLLIIIILLISLLLVIDCVLHCLNCSSKVAARLYLHFVLVYLQICCARVTGYGASYHSEFCALLKTGTVIAVFHSLGTAPTEMSWLKTMAGGRHKEYLTRLKSTDGRGGSRGGGRGGVGRD